MNKSRRFGGVEIKSNRIKKEIETGDICLVKPESWTKTKPDPKQSLPSIVIIRQINKKSWNFVGRLLNNI